MSFGVCRQLCFLLFFLNFLQLWKVFSDSRQVIRILNRLDKCPPDCDGLLHGDVLAELNLAVLVRWFNRGFDPQNLSVPAWRWRKSFHFFILFHFGHYIPQRLKAWPQILSVAASVADLGMSWGREVKFFCNHAGKILVNVHLLTEE